VLCFRPTGALKYNIVFDDFLRRRFLRATSEYKTFIFNIAVYVSKILILSDD